MTFEIETAPATMGNAPQALAQAMSGAVLDGSAPVAEAIAYIYASLLRREPREDEVAHWLATLRSGYRDLRGVMDDVLNSDEARNRAADLPASVGTEAALDAAIGDIYRVVLGREAWADDNRLWKATLRRGDHSAAFMISAILNSPEAAARLDRPAVPEGGVELAVLKALYGVVHDAEPAARHVAAWTAEIAAGPDAYAALVRAVAAGAGPLRPQAGQDGAEIAALIRACYTLCFGRPASDADVAVWSDTIANGTYTAAGAVLALMNSPEAVARAAAGTGSGAVPMTRLPEAIGQIYDLAFHRTASPDEVQHWVKIVADKVISFPELVYDLARSDEAMAKRSLCAELPDGVFIQVAYELLLQRGAGISEVATWQHLLANGHGERNSVLRSFFSSSAAAAANPGAEETNDATKTYLLGTDRIVSLDDWHRVGTLPSVQDAARRKAPSGFPRHTIKPDAGLLVSAVASLYRGEKFIGKFLDNITSQTIFAAHCELIIVDANSPENERAIIEPYLRRFPNIRYVRTPNRIGIYEAWNLGVTLAGGKYVTNTNMDDQRRADSFELQAGVLESLDFVDVAYQDLVYSFDPTLSFAEVAARDFRSNVPVITPQNLLAFNSPHNGPMWRRSLHDDVGMFDASYRSAGDYEFWLRCLRKGKRFFKINQPHVVYYVNPAGISTRPDTRGIAEANRITRTHARPLLSPHMVSAPDAFTDEMGRRAGTATPVAAEGRLAKDWRYTAVQGALRALSTRHRTGPKGLRA